MLYLTYIYQIPIVPIYTIWNMVIIPSLSLAIDTRYNTEYSILHTASMLFIK